MRTTIAAATIAAACSSLACHTLDAHAALSPEAALKAWTEYRTPGAGQARLDPLAGRFLARMRWRTAPEAPWTESQGTIENRWILGGRYLEGAYRGTFFGQPFEGRMLLGYDNAEGTYLGVWIDNAGTGILPVSTGTADATGKVITMRRTFTDPITRVEYGVREVLTIVDESEHAYAWYATPKGGEEYLSMEIRYTRL